MVQIDIFFVCILQEFLLLSDVHISEDGLGYSVVLVKALFTPFWPAQYSSKTLIWSKDRVSSCVIFFIPTMIVNCLTIMLDSLKVCRDFADFSEKQFTTSEMFWSLNFILRMQIFSDCGHSQYSLIRWSPLTMMHSGILNIWCV